MPFINMPFAPKDAHKKLSGKSYSQSFPDDRPVAFSSHPTSRPASCTRNETNCGQVKRYFKRQGKRVVTFLGFSASGYNNLEAAWAIANSILDRYDPARTIVNGGATEEGIGFIYRLAKQRGFSTTGIVSMQAKRTGATISPYVDRIFYIPDRRWGGYIEGTGKLSLVSDLTVQVTHDFYLLGGGEISAIEGRAARRSGKNVEFFAADMNHSAAIARARRSNQPPPQDFKGAAFQVFADECITLRAVEQPRMPAHRI